MKRTPWIVVGLLASLVACLALFRSLATGHPTITGTGSPRYIAFSLKQAENILRRVPTTGAPVQNLGGITRLVGCVYDSSQSDPLIVGMVVPGEAAITLSDFCVALRARALHQWPLVSLDKTPQTPFTGLQTVRWEGGPDMSHSQYGLDMKLADIELKMLGLNGSAGLPSYVELSAAQAETDPQSREIATKMFFVPAKAALARRDNVIAVQELEIGVQARVMSGVQDKAGETFARNLAGRYEIISAGNPRIRRLQALFALAGLGEGLRTLSGGSNLSYWLSDYHITVVPIDPTYKLIKRSVRLKSSGAPRTMTVDGGVELKALISSLHDQDVTALRDLVLRSRPKTDALLWTVPLDGWKVPGALPSPRAAPTTTPALPGDTPGTSFTKTFTNALGNAVGASVGSIHAMPFAAPLLNDGVAPVHFTDRSPMAADSVPHAAPNIPHINATMPDLQNGNPNQSISPPRSAVPLVSPNDLGGVLMNPHPVSAGKGGADVKNSVLRARSADGGMTSRVNLPNTGQ